MRVHVQRSGLVRGQATVIGPMRPSWHAPWSVTRQERDFLRRPVITNSTGSHREQGRGGTRDRRRIGPIPWHRTTDSAVRGMRQRLRRREPLCWRALRWTRPVVNVPRGRPVCDWRPFTSQWQQQAVDEEFMPVEEPVVPSDVIGMNHGDVCGCACEICRKGGLAGPASSVDTDEHDPRRLGFGTQSGQHFCVRRLDQCAIIGSSAEFTSGCQTPAGLGATPAMCTHSKSLPATAVTGGCPVCG